MPRKRRRCDLQVRISLALLRNKAAAFARICLWDDRSMGAMGLAVSGGGKLFQPCARISTFPCIHLGARVTASNATICRPQFSAMGTAGTAGAVCENARTGKGGSAAVGRHLQQLFSSRDEPRRSRSSGARRLHGEMHAGTFVLRPAFV